MIGTTTAQAKGIARGDKKTVSGFMVTACARFWCENGGLP